MNTITLVRHGQASIHAADYDVLSELGREQSRVLGSSWAERGIAFDAAFVGPRRRHRETAEEVIQAAADRGLALPQPQLLERCDEIDALQLAQVTMEKALADCPDLLEQLASKNLTAEGREAMERYDRLFRERMQSWARGEAGFGDMESYADFAQRVRSGLQAVTEAVAAGASAVVFTSGGFMSVAAQLALEISNAKTVEMLFTIANTSVIELRDVDGALSPIRINEIGHLPVKLVTYI